MNKSLSALLVSSLALTMLAGTPLHAQQHTARRLGNPATRFADPLRSPADLRARLTDEALKADVATIVALCDGWQGDLEDFRQAAATAPIQALQIPVGTRLPAMSSRKNGKPVLLRDVLWAGQEPIDAYEFAFYSKGRQYRCVTPKLCCNFWVENVGPDPRVAVLTLECNTPDEVPAGRPLQVCLTVRNTGDAPGEQVTVTLPIPAGATFANPTDGTTAASGSVRWRIPRLVPGASQQLCGNFAAAQPGSLTFLATASGALAKPVETQCGTRVTGIPAILFEVVDLADPIEVGAQETYEFSVLNQGVTTLNNVKVICTLEDSQEFVSGSGAAAVQAQERTITLGPLSALAPKATAKWQVVVKALKAGDVRLSAELTSDEFAEPIIETEATRQY